MTGEKRAFGALLQQAREAAGLGRAELARRVGLDTSYLYRVETGGRHPSRDAVLLLSEALGVDGETLGEWLSAAGYASLPILTTVRAAVRTRGRSRRSDGASPRPAAIDLARWASLLESIGLQESRIDKLVHAMDNARIPERYVAARALAHGFSRVTEALEAPVHTAVIPAAGGQHLFLAAHVMQRLLLAMIREAAESGISKIVLVLPPGAREPLYTPLKEALDLAVVPPFSLQAVEQPTAIGLGDAVLQAESIVGGEPFVVLLPDDVIGDRSGRLGTRRALHRMMDAFHQLDGGRAGHLVAVGSVLKSKLPRSGVARLNGREILPKVYPIRQLVERPPPDDPIRRSPRSYGIIGRYLLRPAIFQPLRDLRSAGRRVELTDALEHLRRGGEQVFGFEVEAARQDLGQVFEQASEALERSTRAPAR